MSMDPPSSFDHGRLIVNHIAGTGATAAVYKCTVSGTNELVAVKRFFRPIPVSGECTSLDDMRSLAEWQREVDALRAVRGHPNVLEYRRHFIEQGYLCIETEYLSGGSLLDYLRGETTRRNGLSNAVAANFVMQVTRGLHHIHQVGYVHKDLKAGNVLLTTDFKTAKIADFGLARLADAVSPEAATDGDSFDVDQQSPQHALEGSVFWMPPETMLRGASTPAADVWSLGCLAVELLSGEPPFFDYQSKASAVYYISQLKVDPVDQWAHIQRLTPAAGDFLRATMKVRAQERLLTAALLQLAWLQPQQAVFSSDHLGASLVMDTPSRNEDTPTQRTASPADFMRTASLQNLTHTYSPAQDPSRELLRTLERCCVPNNTAYLTRWLFGVDDPMQVLVPIASAPWCFTIRHDGFYRPAKDTVALVGNVLAEAINAWRAAPGAGGVSPPAGNQDKVDRAKRESLRVTACSILVHLGRVVQRWKEHFFELLRVCMAAPHQTTWAELVAKEQELLRQRQEESEGAMSLSVVWVLLDSLAQTNFWAYCNVSEMFMDGSVSLTRPGHEASPERGGSATGTAPRDALEQSTSTALDGEGTWTADGDDESIYANSVDGGEQAVGLDTTATTARPNDIPTDPVHLYHQAAAAVLILHTASLLSVAIPSAAPFASRCSAAAAGATWAIAALIKYNPTRSRMLHAFALALEADRKIRGMPSVVDAVIGSSLRRLGDEGYIHAAFGPVTWPIAGVMTALTQAAPVGSSLAALVPRTTSLLASLVSFSAVSIPAHHGARLDRVERESFDDGMTALLCLLHPTGGGLRGGPPTAASDAPTELRTIIDSVESGKILAIAELKGAPESRRIARAAMIVIAMTDRETARSKFGLGPYLAAATDLTASYALRVASAAALLDILDEKITGKALTVLLSGSRSSGATGATQPSRLFAPALELKCPHPDTDGYDGMVGVVSRLVRSKPEVAALLSDDTGLLRSILSKLRYIKLQMSRLGSGFETSPGGTGKGYVRARWELLDLIRCLYEHAADPGRFCDSAELLQELLDIANDASSAGAVRVMACELLNAFASVAVF